jgi:hypothetical protein
MAKPLTFKLNNNEYSLEPVKLDRKKLYGWTDTLVLDEKGQECRLVNIDSSGTMMIPAGGIGQGILDDQGLWVDRSELHAFDSDGNPAEKLPASFDAPIELTETVSMEEFLDHYITAIYTMQGEENCPEFVKSLANGAIHTFDFNYRASFEPSPAFMMENGGELFLLVGKKAEFEFLGLEESGLLDEEEDDDGDTESDDFDFGMM